jgi:small subunit ribosomal protein S7
MSRRRSPVKRAILPDAIYGSEWLTRFVNRVMEKGKKSIAESIVYQALNKVSDTLKVKNPLELLERAVENVTPIVQVKSKRVGGATYQVPEEVRPEKGRSLGMGFLIDAARGRSEKSMAERLAREIMEAIENRGTAFKKREEIHRMADANKAYSHYR